MFKKDCFGFAVILRIFWITLAFHSQAEGKDISLESLIIRASDLQQSVVKVTPTELQEDLERLIYALNYGYSGKDVIPNKLFQTTLNAISNLVVDKVVETDILCKRLVHILAGLPDNHLKVGRDGGFAKCENSKAIGHQRNVGFNLASGKSKPWHLETLVADTREDAKKILAVGITSFPSSDDKIWNGLLEGIQENLPKIDASIIDLRGNTGGMEEKARQIAQIFYGQKDFPHPVQKIVFNQNPASRIFFANVLFREISNLEKNGKEIPASLRKEYVENLGAAFALSHGITYLPQEEKPSEAPVNLNRAFAKPIYILIDRGTVSAGEMAVDYFEKHPQRILLGENTAGTLHFGNVGLLALPHSKILVRIPGYSVHYHDRRFLEKIGISPDIKIPSGEDALKAAIARIQDNPPKKHTR